MPANAAQTYIDVAQLTGYIREQIGRNLDSSPVLTNDGIERPLTPELLEGLRSISRELDSLASQLEQGELSPAPLTLRRRLGSFLKRRLYRLLWWQNHQIKALANLTIRQGREQVNAIDALSERAARQAADIGRFNESILECKRQIYENEMRLRQLESAQLRLQAAAIERNVNEAAQLESLRQQVSGEFAQQLETVGGLSGRIQQEAAQREQLAARLSELGSFTHHTRAVLTLQDRRLSLFIEEARKRLPEPFNQDELREIVNQHSDHKYDSLYLAFEDVFRGSREDIKARQSIYLPVLKDNNLGSVERPILDLGCGRGEWLELLREHGLEARGVDRNETMIDYCRSAGFDVVQSDALAYLHTLPDASLGGVTSFHMVEHLPIETTLALVDESLRVLRSGGLLILETPNPQNIQVGAHAFFFDPTHLKPLPSPMLRFFVEARGFCDVHVRDLHPYPEAVLFPDDGKGIASRLNDIFYGPQDYAVIGRKP